MSCIFKKCKNSKDSCAIYDLIYYLRQQCLDFKSFMRNHIWIILILLVSSLIIYLIQFTEVRIGSHVKAYEINCILLNTSYSILAAALFYLVIDFIPNYTKSKSIRCIINNDFKRLTNITSSCIFILYKPLSFENDGINTHIPTEDNFVNNFKNMNLHDSIFTNTKISKLEYANTYRDSMESLIYQMLQYREYLNSEQIKSLSSIINSKFLTVKITPIEYDIPNSSRIYKDNNQEEIGQSLYQIYNVLRKLK